MPVCLAWVTVLKQLPRVHAIPAALMLLEIALVLDSPTALKQLGQSVSSEHLVTPDALVVRCCAVECSSGAFHSPSLLVLALHLDPRLVCCACTPSLARGAAVLKLRPRVHAIPAALILLEIALVLECPTALKQPGHSAFSKHLAVPDVLVVSLPECLTVLKQPGHSATSKHLVVLDVLVISLWVPCHP